VSAPEASIEDDLVGLLTSASVFAEDDPRRLAGAARLIAARSPRTETELLSAAEFACNATLRALGSREGIGAGKIGSYFLRTFEGLLAKGGLEAAQAGVAPRQPQQRRAPNDPGAPIDWAAVDAGRPRRSRGDA
jgi:hypothetical protein